MRSQKTASARTAGANALPLAVSTGHARDYAAIAEAYARDAVADKKGERYCTWVRLACKRHLDDLKKSQRKAWGYYFDRWHANDICDFIEKLPHVEGEWDDPTIKVEPAQVFILCAVFGWRRRKDGKRRFSRVYIEMARKNAKSTLVAGVALYCLTCEDEVAPQIYIGATTGDQALKVFDPCKGMVEMTPDLQDAFGVQPWAKRITCEMNRGYIRTINAKARTQDGHNPHLGILDELHAHPDRKLFDVIRSAFGARKNPLLWVITTAGYNVKGVCYEQRTLVTKILRGLVEADHYFGIIYTLDRHEDGTAEEGGSDDPYDPKVWGKANPLLNVSVQIEEFQGFAKEAKNSPDSQVEFLTKRLNIWLNASKGKINLAKWLRCSGAVDLKALRGVPCWGGLDLAAVSDFNAFRLVWLVDGRLKTWARRYLPREVVYPLDDRPHELYAPWEKKGLLTVTPGNVTDYDFIERDILALKEEFDIQGIGFDPWGPARAVANRLLNEHSVPMVEFRQGPRSFNPPMKEVDRLYMGGLLDHGGDPLLNWCASNLVARKDANENEAPDRLRSTDKIDDMVALYMGVGLMLAETADESAVSQGFVEV